MEPTKKGRKRKPDGLKKKARQVYATDDEWAQIEKRAQADGKEVSPFVVDKALNG